MKCVKIVYVIIFFTGCDLDKEVFNPVLKKEILNFISHTEKEYEVKKHGFYIIISYEEDNDCYLCILQSYFYNEELLKGYTFLENYLIVYYGDFSDKGNCHTDFINQKQLALFKDTIEGYKSTKECDMEYEAIKRVFKIVDRDSLEVTYTGFY
jgi:hypothetical protein